MSTLPEEMREQSDKTLGKILGEIVGIAIVDQLKEGRWYSNWRTLDDRDKWTVEDFYQLKWPEDMGRISVMCVDIVNAIKPKLISLLEEVDRKAREDFAMKVFTIKTEGIIDNGDLFIKRKPIEQVIINELGYETYKAIQEAADELQHSTKESQV